VPAAPRNKYSPANKSAKKTGLVLVRYADHVLFRHAAVDGLGGMQREAVGWIVREDEDAIILVFDRAVGKDVVVPVEERLASGLVLLRQTIEEVVELG
jgi:hypothetical protein